MRAMEALPAALLLFSSLSACGGKPEGCVNVSGDVAQAVVDGATGDLTILGATGKAVRYETGVYFVAFKIRVAGDEEVGVWALSSIEPEPGMIRSVSAFAQEFTRWPVLEHANGTQPAQDAEACLD